MRKVKSGKFGVSDELVDRIIDMHRRRVGIDVSEFKSKVFDMNKEFEKLAAGGKKEEALELRNKTIDLTVNTDMEAIKSIIATNPDTKEVTFKVAATKLMKICTLENKKFYEGVEIFDYSDIATREEEEMKVGEIAKYVAGLEHEGEKVSTYAMAHTRLMFKAYMQSIANVSAYTFAQEEVIGDIYAFLKGETEVEDKVAFINADLENVPVSITALYGFNNKLFDERVILDTVAGASAAINTFYKKNPLLVAVNEAKESMINMFESLDLNTDTFEDVTGEALLLRDKIKDAKSLKEHLNTARMISAVYDSKFKQNIVVSKAMKLDVQTRQILDLNLQYVAYGLSKVLDGVLFCINDKGIDAKVILASILFNLISVRIRSDREICRGTEILAKDMEIGPMADVWWILTEKIIDYVKDFDVPDFDASEYEAPTETTEVR